MVQNADAPVGRRIVIFCRVMWNFIPAFQAAHRPFE
jgi:hypothetical protein